MDKIYGAIERMDGIQRIGEETFEVFYGFGEDENGKFQYRQVLNFIPPLDFVKSMIIAQINANIHEKITCGFKWKGYLVWLDESNQRNYARDFAVGNIPTYKFGTDTEPVYYTFEDFKEFEDFSKAWAKHISDTVADGWEEKTNIDWHVYDSKNVIQS